MSLFYEWIRNIVIFLLLISVVYQLLPDSDYKKYMRVCAGLILIVIVFSPLLKLTKTEMNLSYFLGLENLKAKIGDIEYPQSFYEAEDERIEAVTQNYKKQLEKEAVKLFEEGPLYMTAASVEIETDIDSGDYGLVKSISGRASAQKPENNNITPVAPVNIGEEKGKTLVPAEYSAEVQKMRKQLADYFMVDISAVSIVMDSRTQTRQN